MKSIFFYPQKCHSRIRNCFLLVSFCVLTTMFGCGRTVKEPNSTGVSATDSHNPQASDPTLAIPIQSISDQRPTHAKQENSTQNLLAEMARKYAEADSYSDIAEWNLQYRINGQLYVETQPTQLVFNRASNQWYVKAFRTETFSDGDLALLRINEVATNNLDQQVKSVPATQWTSLLNDPIANLYLSGATDFPLNSQQSARTELFAPQLMWLMPNSQGATNLLNASWQDAGSGVFNQRSCKVLQCRSSVGIYELWMDQAEAEPARLVLPRSVLDSTLTQSSEVTDLRLSLDFSSIQFNNQRSAPEFLGNQNHKFVRQFIKVPEAFPSPWIGKPSPPISWTIAGKDAPWRLEEFAGRNIAAVFVPTDGPMNPWLQVLDKLKSQASLDATEFVFVPVNFGTNIRSVLDQISDQTKVSIATNGQAVWAELGLKNKPMVVVWDGHGIVQFASETSVEALPSQTSDCVERLAKGESIAIDMLTDYRTFYERYLKRLDEVALKPLPTRYSSPLAVSPTKTDSVKNQLANSDFFQASPLSIDLDRSDLTGSIQTASDSTASDSTASDSTASDSTASDQLVLFKAAAESSSLRSTTQAPLWSAVVMEPQDAHWIHLNPPQLCVLEGFRTLTYFGPDGTKISSRPLQLPPNIGVRQIRIHSATQSVFAFQSGDDQVFVFDLQGKLQNQIKTTAAILDVQLSNQDSSSETDFGVWLVTQDGNVRLVKNSNLKQAFFTWPVAQVEQVTVQPTWTFNGTDKNESGLAALAKTSSGQIVKLHSNGSVTSLAIESNDPSLQSFLIPFAPSTIFLVSPKLGRAGLWKTERTEILKSLDFGAAMASDFRFGSISVQELAQDLLVWNEKAAWLIDRTSGISRPLLIEGPIQFVSILDERRSAEMVSIGTSSGKILTFDTTSRVSQQPTTEHR